MALPEALSVDSFQDRIPTNDRLAAALNAPLTTTLSPLAARRRPKMSSIDIKVECPATILNALKETPDEFAQEARILLAAKLYEIGRLSSGRAAELAGLGRVAFFDILKSCCEFDPRRVEKGLRECQKDAWLIHLSYLERETKERSISACLCCRC
jgi:predicted HTH domain antitoxin